MKEKNILTFEQAKWIEYLEMDEKAGSRELREGITKEIKKMYEEHLKELEKKKQINEPIIK